MTHAGHYIEKCRHCSKVISQCRCAARDKTVRLGVCAECAKRITDADDPTPVDPMPARSPKA